MSVLMVLCTVLCLCLHVWSHLRSRGSKLLSLSSSSPPALCVAQDNKVQEMYEVRLMRKCG